MIRYGEGYLIVTKYYFEHYKSLTVFHFLFNEDYPAKSVWITLFKILRQFSFYRELYFVSYQPLFSLN